MLGERPIGPDDDFFELGGDSLTAARMIQQVGELTGSAVPLGALYECPTVAGLARLLRDGVLVAGSRRARGHAQPRRRPARRWCCSTGC